MAQAALRNNTTKKPRRSGTARAVAANPHTYPDQYAQRVVGDCMAPAIADDSCVLVDKQATYAKGDLVVVYLRPEYVARFGVPALLKRVVMPMLGKVDLPYTPSPTCNVVPVLVVEQDHPRRQLWLPADWLLAVHRCLGPVPAEVTVVEGRGSRVSAGMPADLLNRREAILRLASTLPAAVLAAPAAQGAIPPKENPMNMIARLQSHADAHLIELGKRYDALRLAINEVFRPGAEAYQRYKAIEPEKPDGLRVRPGDEAMFKRHLIQLSPREVEEGFYDITFSDLERNSFAYRETQYLRVGTWTPIPDNEPMGQILVDYVPVSSPTKSVDLVAKARAAEILAVYAEWQAACDAAAESVGYGREDDPARDEELDALHAQLRPIELAIIKTPAATREGLAVKLGVLVGCYDPLDDVDDESDETIDRRIILSMLRDFATDRQLAAVAS